MNSEELHWTTLSVRPTKLLQEILKSPELQETPKERQGTQKVRNSISMPTKLPYKNKKRSQG